MKKLLITLFALLMLVGCSSKGYSKISDGDEVLFKGPDITYTKDELYNSLKKASEESIENDIINKIAAKMNLDLQKVDEEAEEMLQLYKSMGYESAIIAYYGSDESFKQMYINDGILKLLSGKYIDEKYDELISKDKPVKMQLVSFGDEETANKFIEDINSGSTFETAAINNGYTTETTPSVYIDSDDLVVDVKQYLNETNNLGLSSIITSTSSSTDANGNISNLNTYYVLNIISRDAKEFLDDYKAVKQENLDTVTVKNWLFENHNIEFFDQDIYEMMKSTYEVLK